MIVILHKHLVEKKTRKIGNEFVRRLGCYLILDIIVRTFWSMIFFNFCAMFLFELVEVWILDQPGRRGVRGWAENLEIRIV